MNRDTLAKSIAEVWRADPHGIYVAEAALVAADAVLKLFRAELAAHDETAARENAELKIMHSVVGRENAALKVKVADLEKQLANRQTGTLTEERARKVTLALANATGSPAEHCLRSSRPGDVIT